MLLKEYLDNLSIEYKEGSVREFEKDFSNLWIDHVKYVNHIQNFPYDDEYLLNPNMESFVRYLARSVKKYKKQRLFIAFDNDKAIGVIQVGCAGPRAKIILLHILPEYRSKGIGSCLLKKAMYWIRMNGAKNVRLGTHAGKEDALKFYEKHGFKPRLYKLMRNI